MNIYKNIEIKDLALEYKNNLILADFHIGFEESLNKQGILIPRTQFKDLISRLKKILDKKYDKIIINGDLKHEFGTISKTEWKQTLELIDFLSNYCNKIILIKGNHDNILGPIAQKRNLEILDSYQIDDILITHGNNLPEDLFSANAFPKRVIIIGHEHPAISFKEKSYQKFKCFLKGKYKSSILIVQPSFNLLIEGTDIKKESLLSPFLQQDLSNFEVFIVEDKIYKFKKLKEIKS